jgi:processive 1,2-diacylglycerol beta-glucosyltransferase
VRRPVVIISASIGAGHDGAAREIARRLTLGGIPVVRHDFLDLLPPGLGRALRATYARQLVVAPGTWGRLLHAVEKPGRVAGVIRLSRRLGTSGMRTVVGPGTAAVVSTYPLAGQVLAGLREDGSLQAPLAVVMTDPSVHPLCVAAGADVHLAPGRPCAAELSRQFGGRVETVTPLVPPEFRPPRDRAEVDDIRRRLGLPLDAKLAVVVAGSWGVGQVAATARDVAAAGMVTPVVVCGRNAGLRARLRAEGVGIALGWVGDMPSLLRAADVVVHNAGGLTSAEALATGLPLISYRCLPGHGVANAAVLSGAGLSSWPQTPRALATALWAALGRPARLGRPDPAGADAAAVIAELAGVPAHTGRDPSSPVARSAVPAGRRT